MKEFGDSIGLAAILFFIGYILWLQHVQYMAGHETLLFVHKTPEEIRIREATVKKLEIEASQMK